MIQIPAKFVAFMLELYGEEGQAWLDRLPALVAELAAEWHIRVGQPDFGLSYNYVLPAESVGDGSPAILKVGVPNPELLTEMAALELYDGRGAVRLLASDPNRGAMLLQRVLPGTMLAEMDDEDKTVEIAAGVMQRLWRPVPVGTTFPSIGDWAAGFGRLRQKFDGGTGPLPPQLVARAEALFAELLPDITAPVLLHGDLHHDNILSAGDGGWVAIDPKGVTGEPAWEPARFLHNPGPDFLEKPNPAKVLDRRIRLFAECLSLEYERIAAWGFCDAVLGAWWSIEDGDDGWEYGAACAQLFLPLL